MKLFKNFTRRPDGESGMMAVEAGIGLLVFMIFMLTVYTMTPMFMAQSMIGHALEESAQSLAIETYGTSILHDDKATVSDLGKGLTELFCNAKSALQVSSYDNEPDAAYTTTDRWFDPKGELKVNDEVVIAVVKDRFATYLAGGVTAADRMLETLGIEDGLDGIDFAGTQLDGSDLTICISYKISVMMRQEAANFGTFSSKQSVTSRIWGKP